MSILYYNTQGHKQRQSVTMCRIRNRVISAIEHAWCKLSILHTHYNYSQHKRRPLQCWSEIPAELHWKVRWWCKAHTLSYKNASTHMTIMVRYWYTQYHHNVKALAYVHRQVTFKTLSKLRTEGELYKHCMPLLCSDTLLFSTGRAGIKQTRTGATKMQNYSFMFIVGKFVG